MNLQESGKPFCGVETIICLFLTLLGWFPGMVFAFIVVICEPPCCGPGQQTPPTLPTTQAVSTPHAVSGAAQTTTTPTLTTRTATEVAVVQV